MKKTKIEKYDHLGRGIFYDETKKITFVPYTLKDEEIEYEIVNQNSKYNTAKVLNIISTSPNRIEPVCPYFKKCGGCDFLHCSYEESLNIKRDTLIDIFKRYLNLDIKPVIVGSKNRYNYRNKLKLQIVNNKIGFYQKETHQLTEIDYCYLASEAINALLKDLKFLNIKNGEITIRINYNREILIEINSKSLSTLEITKLKECHKIAGIILNGKVISGDNHFVEKIGHKLFQVSSDSFFQVNSEILETVADLLKKNISSVETLLDLYCGVGTLGILVSDKVKEIYGIEKHQNAVTNALTNSRMNNLSNAKYFLGSTSKVLPKINKDFDCLIVDPPRKGLDKVDIEKILEIKPKQLIYMSCDAMSLQRDLKELLTFFEIKKTYLLDMFPNTHHLECLVFLDYK